ncbi:MAG TPA: biotin carboxylase N-terminal domain-containing protein [Burkholderiaceae bacterium]|nr:biotin carboxylase N-terminal domain-containing protein [Burkholderiaceae bacterium]
MADPDRPHAPKVLIANRGEIACRVIRAARSLGMRSVGVYSEPDAQLPHVVEADEACAIGPARAAESYLSMHKLIEVAQATGAGLVHPGYGFLAENADFARRCAQQGLTFVGPSPEVISLMGDKERARQAAIDAGVPVLPGTGKLDLSDPDGVQHSAGSLGFPLLVKAAAGGGGIGMRRVDHPDQLLEAVRATSSLAHKAFADGSVYLERLVSRPRHVEIQLFGCGRNGAVHLYERDCSLQRRHQKVIEEARAPGVPAGVLAEMAAAAVRLALACQYEGAGTIEFLLDTDDARFYFLEMNTRIQVEHPVTEMITGTDLVGAQLQLADGTLPPEQWTQTAIGCSGHAVEARLYAENPAKGFIPSPGKLTRFALPDLPGVRIETGYREGNTVTPFYDPMIAKIIAADSTREAAIDRLADALARVEVQGIHTNAGYLRAILRHSDFRRGDVHTGLLAQQHAELVAAASAG